MTALIKRTDVYIGLWTDWSSGSITGARLTLDRGDANILIASLAVLVSFIGTRIWRISCFFLYQICSPINAGDGLYHQRQALLRNCPSATAGFTGLVEILWAWRHGGHAGKAPFRQILPVLIYTMLLVIVLALASIFSSRITTGPEVLVIEGNCGVLNASRALEVLGFRALPMTTFFDARRSDSYARQCSSSQSTCNIFVQPQLHTSVNSTVGCPFTPNMCQSNDTNLLLDTGHLDTHADFGLNSPPAQRLTYRRRLHCAPLVTNGHKSTWSLGENKSYTRYHYGNVDGRNYSYDYTQDTDPLGFEDAKQTPDYLIGSYITSYENGSLANPSEGELIPELRRPDADVTIYHLSTPHIAFQERTYDPWYKATKHKRLSSNFTFQGDIYFQDEPAAPLACVQQEQICNPNLPENARCTPLSGTRDLRNNAAALAQDTESKNRLRWLLMMTTGTSTNSIVATLGTQALKSKETLFLGLQGPLPDDQWQNDVQHWLAVSLVAMQMEFVKNVRGPTDSKLLVALIRPATSESRTMCRNQKITSTGHVSFSMFGLLGIVLFGILTTFLSLTMESVVFYLRKRWRSNDYMHLNWCTHRIYQLQRLAHEGIGVGTWTGATESVPITAFPHEALAVLDLADRNHPKLKHPNRDFALDTEGLGPSHELLLQAIRNEDMET